MVNAYAPFSLNDETLTGKVLGDFTIDFCKTLSGANVSQVGMTLTELGVGDYSLMNPNIDQTTICGLHLTLDDTAAAVVRFDPFAPGTTTYLPLDVREIFSFGDITQTGKLLADITIDYFKTVTGADRSQADLALTELGAGAYSLLCPGMTTTVICRLHLTANSTKRAVMAFTPLDGVVSAATPIRTQILTALAARLATITTANGYRTNIGSDVDEWSATALDPNESALRVEYRDEAGTTEWYAVGLHLHTLPVTLRVVCQNNTAGSALTTVRSAMADIYQAIYTDVTFGGLAQDTNQEGQVREDYKEAGDRAAGAEVVYRIEYTTAPGTP